MTVIPAEAGIQKAVLSIYWPVSMPWVTKPCEKVRWVILSNPLKRCIKEIQKDVSRFSLSVPLNWSILPWAAGVGNGWAAGALRTSRISKFEFLMVQCFFRPVVYPSGKPRISRRGGALSRVRRSLLQPYPWHLGSAAASAFATLGFIHHFSPCPSRCVLFSLFIFRL